MLNRFFFYFFISVILGDVNWKEIVGNEKLGDFYNASQQLYIELFETRGYKRQLSPVYSFQSKNLSELDRDVPRLVVNITLGYVRVIDLAAQSQEAQQLFEFEMEWQDPRLMWNPDDFGGIEQTWLQFDSVWQPDNSVANAKVIEEVILPYQKQIELHSDGSLYLDSMQVISIPCPMDMSHFPFDEQTCVVGFEVYNYPLYLMTQNARISPQLDERVFKGNGEWTISNMSVATKTILTYVDFPYDYVYFTLVYKRQPHFYIWVIVVPAFLLTFLSVIGLFWPSNSADEKLVKLSLGLTTMMSMTVLLELVSNQIPKTSKFPVIGIYVIIDFCLIGLGCVMVVVLPRDKSPSKSKENDFRSRIFRFFASKNVIPQIVFQLLNLINLIVLLSFWN